MNKILIIKISCLFIININIKVNCYRNTINILFVKCNPDNVKSVTVAMQSQLWQLKDGILYTVWFRMRMETVCCEVNEYKYSLRNNVKLFLIKILVEFKQRFGKKTLCIFWTVNRWTPQNSNLILGKQR